MTAIPTETFVRALLDLLREAFEGSPEKWSWFTTNEPAAGVFGAIDGLSAAAASAPPAPGRPSVAAHVEHLRFSVANANAHLRGENPKPEWRRSWDVSAVDHARWDELRAGLRREYETLGRLFAAAPDWSREAVTGAMATVIHAA